MKKLALVISLIISLSVLTGCKQEEPEAVDANQAEAQQQPQLEQPADQTNQENTEQQPQEQKPAPKQEQQQATDEDEEVSQQIQQAFKQQQQQAKQEPDVPEYDPNETVAVVYGDEITEGDVMAQIEPQLKSMGQQIPPQYRDAYIKQMRGQVVKSMIVEKLLSVKAQDINVPDEKVDETFQQMVDRSGISMEGYVDLIEQKGFTVEKVKEDIRKGLKYQQFFEQELGDKVQVTEADANEFYTQNLQRFKQPEQVKARHILIKTDPNTDPNKASQRAQEVLDLVQQPDANFAELAKEYSEGPSSTRGGDLGWFGRGQMVKPFEEAAFALDPNQVSEIVKTDFGYHIIKVEGKKEARTVPFAEAKVEIMEMLKRQKQSELGQAYINELMEEAKAAGNLEMVKPIEPPAPPQPQRVPQPRQAPAEEPVEETTEEQQQQPVEESPAQTNEPNSAG